MTVAERKSLLAQAIGRQAAETLARMLEREYECERCHRAPATELFDRLFVCSRCRRVLEKKLVKHG